MGQPLAGLDAAAGALRRGGVAVYPTETLYGLGAVASDAAAVARVAAIKDRPFGKPFPLLIGAAEQLARVTPWQDPTLETLTQAFWPGPLTVLVPAAAGLAPLVCSAEGFAAVRLTAHPLAAALSRAAGAPLVATSANLSGQPAVSRPELLDPAILQAVDAALLEQPWPAGGLASTLVRILGSGVLTVLRQGAVSVERLRGAGFAVADPVQKI